MAAKKYSKKVEQRAWLLGIEDIRGWLLVSKDEKQPDWNIAWIEPFPTRRSALQFAEENHWPKPYRAIRGRMTVRL